jgi:hypothetical protein
LSRRLKSIRKQQKFEEDPRHFSLLYLENGAEGKRDDKINNAF